MLRAAIVCEVRRGVKCLPKITVHQGEKRPVLAVSVVAICIALVQIPWRFGATYGLVVSRCDRLVDPRDSSPQKDVACTWSGGVDPASRHGTNSESILERGESRGRNSVAVGNGP